MAVFRYFLHQPFSVQISMTSIRQPGKDKVTLVDKWDLILTNLTFYDQHYDVAHL
jgi:hypothetical protein